MPPSRSTSTCPLSKGEVTVFVRPAHGLGAANEFRVRLSGPDDYVKLARAEGGAVTFGRLTPGNYQAELLADDPNAWSNIPNGAVTLQPSGHATVRLRPTSNLHVTFHDVDADATVTAASLEQGSTLKVQIRVSRHVALGYSVKFYYKDARTKKKRPATRSVTGGAYRYLSRVRVATNDDGIRNPIKSLAAGGKTKIPCTSGRWNDGHLEVKTFTITGLEWNAGPEVLVAEVYHHDQRMGRAELAITVTQPAERQGAYRVWDHTESDHYKTRSDTKFAAIYNVSGGFRGNDVRVGICDTGVFDDSADKNYLQARIVAGKYFSTNIDEDRATAAGDGNDDHILIDSPSKHGTNVAAQAAWGSTKVKLVDVMVQKGQMAADMNPVTAERAFRWAGQQQVAVLNCSKIMPFNSDEANAAVTELEDTTLFMASGGNRGQCVPFHYNEIGQNPAIRNRFSADFGLGDVPRNFANTLFVGGHNRTPAGIPCHHSSRGYGPGLDVMVYGDAADIYCPWDLTFAFREGVVKAVRDLTLEWLAEQIEQRNDVPEEVQGSLPGVKGMKLRLLQAKEGRKEKEEIEYQALLREAKSSPNPEYGIKQYLQAAKALIETWAWPGDPDQNRDDVVTLAENLEHLNAIVRRVPHVEDDTTNTWDGVRYGALREHAARQIGTGQAMFSDEFGDIQRLRGFGAVVAELKKSRDEDLANDTGISFGLPVASNIAGKIKLIRTGLTPTLMRRILIDTSDYTEGFESECLAKGVLNPLRAYFAAYDNDVEQGGECPRTTPPVVDQGINDQRRVYYYFYYMNDEGKALYDAVKDELKEIYAAANVDLVEAEPPIQIKDEPITYVTNTKIRSYGWKNVVDMAQPLTHAPKHLRLILANQCAHVEPTFEKITMTYQVGGSWQPDNPPQLPGALGGMSTVYSQVTEVTAGQGFWQCKMTIRDPNTRRIFPATADHILHAVKVVGGDPVPAEHIRVRRTSDTAVTVRITDAQTANDIRQNGRNVEVVARVVQQIGGNRDGNNIFTTNKYHAGPNGSDAANRSALVLFLHEIGHALGMVPVNHTEHYDNAHGGAGHHCAHNTVEVTNATAVANYGIPGDGTSGDVKIPERLVDPDAGPPCIMYHTRSRVHHESVYCDECINILTQADPATWTW